MRNVSLNRVRIVAPVLLAFACVLHGVTGTASGAEAGPPDAESIFRKARSVFAQQIVPPRLRSHIGIRFSWNGKAEFESYTSLYRASDGMIATASISDQENANPHVPQGLNVNIFGVPLSKPEFIEPFGVPELSPIFAFGMVPRSTPRLPAHPDTSPPDLREIGGVSTYHRDYNVRLTGIESCSGNPAYHLKLEPLSDPVRYRLRDAWVRTSDFSTCRLVVAKNFAAGPGWTVPWAIDFVREAGGWSRIGTETALDVMTYRHKPLLDVTISFDAVEPAESNVVTELQLLGLSGTDGRLMQEPIP